MYKAGSAVGSLIAYRTAPDMATHDHVQNEPDTPDTVSDTSDSIPDNVPDMNGH